MPTTASPAPDVQELLAAYRTLDIPPQASPRAVQSRYRELVQLHNPGIWPNGSAEQAKAERRMHEINTAYALVEAAPLEHREIPAEPKIEPPAIRLSWLARIDINPVRFLFGMAAGRSLGYWLSGHGVMQDPLYAWFVAIAMGIVFGRTSRVSNLLLGEIVTALRRR